MNTSGLKVVCNKLKSAKLDILSDKAALSSKGAWRRPVVGGHMVRYVNVRADVNLIGYCHMNVRTAIAIVMSSTRSNTQELTWL